MLCIGVSFASYLTMQTQFGPIQVQVLFSLPLYAFKGLMLNIAYWPFGKDTAHCTLHKKIKTVAFFALEVENCSLKHGLAPP